MHGKNFCIFRLQNTNMFEQIISESIWIFNKDVPFNTEHVSCVGTYFRPFSLFREKEEDSYFKVFQ